MPRLKADDTPSVALDLANAVTKAFTHPTDRLWNVVVPPPIYTETLALLRTVGAAGPASRAVWVFGTSSRGSSPGWLKRVDELHRERPTSSLHAPTRARSLDTVDVFVDELAGSAPSGLVGVLAPQHIEDSAAWMRDVDALVAHEKIAGVRWVLVDAVRTSLGELDRTSRAWRSIVVPSIEQADADELRHILADLTLTGAELSPELDARIAPSSPLRSHEMTRVRLLLAEAERASAAGDHARAAELRGRAQSQLEARGLDREVVHVAMLRARSLVADGVRDLAQTTFVAAVRRAEQLGMHEIIPEAYASLGSLHVSQARFADAAAAYTRAGDLAERRGSRALAAETRRCAGHAALNANLPHAAIDAWRSAFTLLDAPVPRALPLETPDRLVVLGLALAEVFENGGSLAAASALRGHVEQIERRNPRAKGSLS